MQCEAVMRPRQECGQSVGRHEPESDRGSDGIGLALIESWDFIVRSKLIMVQPSHFMAEKT